MEKLKLVFVWVFCLCIMVSNAQTVDWVWTVGAGGSSSDAGKVISVDNMGNVINAGSFSGGASFGSFSLTAVSSYSDIYLAKYNKNGVPLWVKSCSGSAGKDIKGIALDEKGNIYISGYFIADFSIGSSTIYSAESYDIYIAKFTSNGELAWMRSIGNEQQEIPAGIAVQGKNVFVSGSYRNTLKYETDSISAVNNTDIFILNLDTAANFGWLKTAGGKGFEYPRSIAASDNLLFVSGQFLDTCYFDNQFVIGQKSSDVFTAAYNTNGDVKWVKAGLGNYGNYPNAMCADKSGNAYITGCFGQTLTFDNFTLTCNGMVDFFVAKYDSNGNCKWARNEGGTSYDQGFGISADYSGIVVTGFFNDVTKIGGIKFNGPGGNDIFIAEFETNGAFKWAKIAGGMNWDFAEGVCKTANSVYVTGYINGSGSFGPISFTSKGKNDIFICKIGIPEPPSIIILEQPNSQTVCMNENAYFSVYAKGSNMNYQWKFNRTSIAGATDSFYVVQNLQMSDNGKYICEISDSTFSIETNEAVLSVVAAPIITSQPTNKTIEVGKTATFKIVATGINPEFQWQKNGNNLTGETTNTLVLSNVDYSDSGTYKCIVHDMCGTTESVAIYLTVKKSTGIEDDFSTFSAEIFPNPSPGKIWLSSLLNNSNQVRIDVINANGRINKTLNLNNIDNLELDLSDLPKGLYLIRLQSDGVTGFHKLLLY